MGLLLVGSFKKSLYSSVTVTYLGKLNAEEVNVVASMAHDNTRVGKLVVIAFLSHPVLSLFHLYLWFPYLLTQFFLCFFFICGSPTSSSI